MEKNKEKAITKDVLKIQATSLVDTILKNFSHYSLDAVKLIKKDREIFSEKVYEALFNLYAKEGYKIIENGSEDGKENRAN